MDTLKVQNQIRNNADEISNYLNDLMKWETKIQRTDQAIRERKQKNDTASVSSSVCGVRADGTSSASRVNTTLPRTDLSAAPTEKEASAAKHTYDVGYKKWEKINVDELLNDDDEASTSPACGTPATKPDSSLLTPASIIPNLPPVTAAVPAPRNPRPSVDMEAYERQRGNDAFEKGNFHQAVKHYTTCLGLKVGNFVAFSNRAMAYLRLKEYAKAEMDCNSALRIESTHVKSYLRRATARNALGKHRAAIADLQQVLQFEPSNKTANQELKKSLDLLKAAALKAPLISITPTWIGDTDEDIVMAGPELPSQPDCTTKPPETHHTMDKHDSGEKPVQQQRRVSFDDTVEVIDDTNDAAKIVSAAPSPSIAQHDNENTHPLSAADPSQTSSKSLAKESSIKANSTKTKSIKSKKTKSKPTPTIGWYQVERGLLSYRNAPNLLAPFIESLKIEHLVSSSCLETGVVVELLQVVCAHYADANPDMVRKWLDGMKRLSNFSLLNTLWTSEEKSKLRDLFESLRECIGAELSREYLIAYNI